jgi:hypothetical protein
MNAIANLSHNQTTEKQILVSHFNLTRWRYAQKKFFIDYAVTGHGYCWRGG